jgi:hypothetical protein
MNFQVSLLLLLGFSLAVPPCFPFLFIFILVFLFCFFFSQLEGGIACESRAEAGA